MPAANQSRHCLALAAAIGPQTNIGVAVSGGADSVFLLTTLKDLGVATAVLHVNHKLRAAESDTDEAFVRQLAESLALPFIAATLPPPEGNTEQEARRLRYEFFHNCIEQGHCAVVATGHTLDDQAETVLFRFLRGSGTAGLSGIRPSTETGIIRPLLGLRRQDIRTSLIERNIPWREDSSNLDTGYQRNRIRLNVLPELTLLNPSLPDVLASTAEWARDEEDYWTAELQRLEPLCLTLAPETVFLDIGPFSLLPVAVQRRMLRRAIAHVRGHLRAIGFHHIEAIRHLMATREGSGRIQLPELDIYRSFDQLRIAPQDFDSRLERDFAVPLAIPGETTVPERGLAITLELVDPSAVYNYNNDLNALDRAKCPGPLQLRNWRPGDQFERPGHSGAVKVKTLFQDDRIPLWERRRWPVITMGEIIVWTRRFGVAAGFRTTGASGSVLRIVEHAGAI